MIEARVPPHYDFDPQAAASCAPWLIATLLEEGSTEELRWLLAHFGLPAVRDWVESRGHRQLSARSLAFWSVVLESTPTQTRPGGDLWPL